MIRIPGFLLFIFVSLFHFYGNENILFFEDFTSLDNWKSIKLPLASHGTEYKTVLSDELTLLECTSKAGASSLQHTTVFDVYEYPVLKWKWKTESLLTRGDVTKKNGDDYPIRVYVNFIHDEKTAGAGFMIRYNFVQKMYKLEIPRYSLNYIIESKNQPQRYYPNPFDPENSKIIILQSGTNAVKKWFEERVNILDDFKLVYGFDPPAKAYIAIMADTDNTRESVVSWVDYISVSKK